MAALTMAGIIELIASNLGVSAPDMVTFVVVVGCFIFLAMNFRLGIMILFFLTAGLFIVFEQIGWSSYRVLLVVMVVLALMAISILISFGNRSAATGGVG